MNHRMFLVGPLVSALGCADPVTAVTGLSGAGAVEGIDSGGGGEPQDPDPEEEVEETDPIISMTRSGMVSHLEALMGIAEANDNNRSTGTEGYSASVAYVTEVLQAAGYGVAVYDFAVEDDVWNSEPSLDAEGLLAFDEDFYPFSYTGAGSVTAPITAVDIEVPPPDEENSTSSGCEAADFGAFPEGNIALLQRGSCAFQIKVDRAVAAGAAGVLIFNEGQTGRRDLFYGTLEEEAGNEVPVFALSYNTGLELLELSPETEITMTADFSRIEVPSVNIFAETSGNSDRAVVVGAHLDSVPDGPGINDNGSGIAMLLEMATQVAASDWEPENQIRFAFWGAEELGLVGSIDYVMSMTEQDRSRILANLNFDMVASPNPARMVYDGSGSLGGGGGPTGSARIEQIFGNWFNAQGLAYLETPFDGRSDYGPFIWTGIPAGGLFTGAEGLMSASESDSFGGQAFEAYDPCYHQECDTIDNLDLDVLDELAAAAVHSVVQVGNLEGPLIDGPGGPAVRAQTGVRSPSDWVPTSCGSGPRVWRR